MDRILSRGSTSNTGAHDQLWSRVNLDASFIKELSVNYIKQKQTVNDFTGEL